MADDDAAHGPAGLRDGIRAYLRAMHQAYLDAGGGTTEGSLGDVPFTVAVVAARSLHLVATREEVPAPAGAADDDAVGPVRWRTVFLDPSVVPALGVVPAGADEIPAVRDAVGISTTLYHLAAGPGGALTPHHATHTGTGLATRERAGR